MNYSKRSASVTFYRIPPKSIKELERKLSATRSTNKKQNYFTKVSLAQRWGCDPKSVYNYQMRGWLNPPHIQKNKFHLDDVLAFESLHPHKMK